MAIGISLAREASLRVDTQFYDQADELFHKALDISERAGPASSMQVVGILNNIAVCAIERGRFAAPEPYLLRSIRIRSAALGGDDPAMISLLEKDHTRGRIQKTSTMIAGGSLQL